MVQGGFGKKEWRCPAHVQAPAQGKDHPPWCLQHCSRAGVNRSRHCPPSPWESVHQLSGTAGLSFPIFILGKTWVIPAHLPPAPYCQDHPKRGIPGLQRGAACSAEQSTHRGDGKPPLPSTADSPAHHLQGADNSRPSQGAGPAKGGSECVFEVLAGKDITPNEFLLPWAPGRKQPLALRSALARAALQHRTCASAELQ